MPRLTPALLACLVVALACWSSYRHGRTVEAGHQALQRQADIIATAKAVRADVSTQAAAHARALQRQDRAAARVREIDREAAHLPDRPDCAWTPAELHLAAARWCARYADDHPAACQLPHSLPGAAPATEPPPRMGTPD